MNFDPNHPELYIDRVFRRTSGVYNGDLYILTQSNDGYLLTDINNNVSRWSHVGDKPFGCFYPSCIYWELMPDTSSDNTEEDTRELI